jgi:phosphopantothenoylcysteine synthetase/decarboxylase
MSGKAVLLLLAPATANTFGKIASDRLHTCDHLRHHGHWSRYTGDVVPAMHVAMYNHHALFENLEKIKSRGIGFIGPDIKVGIAKMPLMKR